MAKRTYDWKRFWCPRTGVINLSDDGYLYDPDSKFGFIYNKDVLTLESLSGVPCLILLGEPGMGKSTALRSHKETITRKTEEPRWESLWIDLRAYQTDTRLCKALFENPIFLSWLRGGHDLHLFLDSLDECLLRIDTVAALLREEFRKYPTERLRLKIACRTAEWPIGLEEGLRELWPGDGVGVYELAPLRKVDVAEAVAANSLDPGTFMREVDRRRATPFAVKPVTLKFLLDIFKRDGCLPSQQSDLYYHGCKILCEETSQSRRDAKLLGRLSADKRLSIAARIAAVTVFANRYSIWTGPDLGDVPQEDVPISTLLGTVDFSGSQLEVDEEAIRETLDTGLFSSRGPSRMSWAHQTYAEFLAAWHFVQNKAESIQIMSLIVHPDDPEGRIVPQLHQVSAWLASMHPQVFRAIMKVDPGLLLRSDISTVDAKDREALVNNLLRLYDQEKLIDDDWEIRRHYCKLNYPGLAEQLKPYIEDVSRGVIVRRVAIDIAKDCQLQELQEVLATIALDQSQERVVRIKAAYAVSKVADTGTRIKLKPLATCEGGDDPDDELKGCALIALWPESLSCKELLHILTPPRRRNLIGLYKSFICQDVVEHLSPRDLPDALEWVEAQRTGLGLDSPFGPLTDEIVLKAWFSLDHGDVLGGLARVILRRITNYDPLISDGDKLAALSDELRSDATKRRRLISALVPLIWKPDQECASLSLSSPPLVFPMDVDWMVEQIQQAICDKEKRVWAYLIDRMLDISEPELSQLVFSVSQQEPILWDVVAPLFEPMILDSPQAKRAKETHSRMRELQESKNHPPLVPSPEQRITVLLDRFESGDTDAWWHLNVEMTLGLESTHYGDELEADLTRLPGWQSASPKIRLRIIEAAKTYLLEQDPHTSQWFGTKTFHRPAFAGYRALLLLGNEKPEYFLSLSSEVWEKWTPTIVGYPVSTGFGNEEQHQRIVSMAYQHAPEEVLHRLLLMIDQENRESDHIFITSKILGCWDEKIERSLLEKARELQLKPKCMGSLLCELLKHGSRTAEEFAGSLIMNPIPQTEPLRERAVVAACALANYAPDAGWSLLWPAFLGDSEYGRQVISAVAHGEERHSTGILSKLTEEQAGDLFVWLVREFPYSEDPQHDDAHWVGPEESVRNWRDSIIRYLRDIGTFNACRTIHRIARELPGLHWLKWTVIGAKSNALRRTWVPSDPLEILHMASNQALRLVNSGDQLMDVIEESLGRLETRLRGETPSVVDFWNEGPYKPKDENRFSDCVKRHLDEDLRCRGIVVNREVQIRRGTGGAGSGQQTDIHVTAVVPGHLEAYDSVTVIIESKGCWHPDLNHAMESQLVDRYLKENECSHGLYLVGWFYCKQWHDGDRRKEQTLRLNSSMGEAVEKLTLQARTLSTAGLCIRACVLDIALR